MEPHMTKTSLDASRLPFCLRVNVSAALLITACFAIFTISGCGTTLNGRSAQQSASVVDYLYPNASEAPKLEPTVTTLRPPVRVGIAFVPTGPRGRALPEADRVRLLERTKASFEKLGYIGAIEVIPTQYLKVGGGFENMEQVARMFRVDLMALVSYDQVQFTDSNRLSLLYWTIVGAYVINGNQYDVQTMLDVSVFDVQSRKLLIRAPGVSEVKGGASYANFSERSRAAQVEGYNNAVNALVPKLQAELDTFRERAKTASDVKIVPREGYRGGGSADVWMLVAALFLVGFALVHSAHNIRRERHLQSTRT
jgi:rhombotail lipoprotein